MNENFSENLKKARRDAQMTQAEVAKIVGVAKNTYFRNQDRFRT